MILLGIETSCDETGAALIDVDESTQTIRVLSNIIASSLSLHATTGGIIPEIAAREQILSIQPVLIDALSPLGKSLSEALEKIDAIAVTYGPGLIGSLLVGVETARTLSLLSQKPIIPVNHLYGHMYANWLEDSHDTPIKFPALALVVSGGHTDLVLIKNHKDVKSIGGTRDDAAGEAFDKIGRLLSLPYPAGPLISQLATRGDPHSFKLPRPMWDSKDYDFSFSGLKTAVLTEVKKIGTLTEEITNDLCASVEKAIVDSLVHKTLLAAKEMQVASILLGGGVAANTQLRQRLTNEIQKKLPLVSLHIPNSNYCTDNAAMIAAAGYFNNQTVPWQDVTCDPELYY